MTPEQKTETLDHIADRIAYKYLDKTVASAKLKSEILSALRNERERCAKAMCLHCQRPDRYHPAEMGDDKIYRHKRIGHEATWEEVCLASAIREGR